MNKEENVFVKPDEQNQACLGSAMERKDFHKMEQFFLHSNEVNHINREDYEKIELLVNAAKAFARSTYQGVYIIDYFHQDFIYASDNLAYLCGLEPEQLMDAGYQMYIDHVPDADLQMLLEVNKKGFDLFNELPVGDRLDYTISYDFHLTNGRHSRLIDSSSPHSDTSF